VEESGIEETFPVSKAAVRDETLGLDVEEEEEVPNCFAGMIPAAGLALIPPIDGDGETETVESEIEWIKIMLLYLFI